MFLYYPVSTREYFQFQKHIQINHLPVFYQPYFFNEQQIFEK